MGDAAIIVVRLIVEGWAAYARTQGKTEAEINTILSQVINDVISRDPADLPDK
jgi:hypothetical protein